MNVTKLVISVDHCNVFSIELVFNIFQRKVFADNKLDVFILTLDVNGVKETAEHIKNCCFTNLNELIVTGDCHDAFLKADCLLLMTNLNLPDRKVLENVQNLEHVFKKAKSFDLLANPDARVVVMGPWSNTWLQIFAEVATRLRKCNFTGLSRHHCEVHELSDVYVWGKHFVDITEAKKKTKFEPRKYDSQCTVKTQNVVNLLTPNWIDNYFTPQFEAIKTATTYRHCVISAVCHHIIDWYRGTGDRTVCMTISVHQPGHINDGVFSSYPVVIGQSGQMSVRNIETDALHFIKLYRYLEIQQRERCLIRNYIKSMSESEVSSLGSSSLSCGSRGFNLRLTDLLPIL
ncbi:PREDICTED: malate dehydrogenase-like [Diuraphis noxia]|uniref:malate dehydrogenase-like n=1 Tax=Diuraphis noxia TaxID=143948 RepID=UPI0007635768|nr:PREDICTED: malate dehydrogenase-like [Diuraphis noxia]